MITEQTSFSGGMFRQYDTTRVGANQYPYLSNGRVREDIVDVIRKPLELALPESVTLLQGIYAAENLVVVFGDGKAYYKDYSLVGSAFTKINGFAMSATAPYIYAEIIPTSSLNYSRKTSAGNATDPVTIFGTAAQSPSGLLCQDGVTQPRLILSSGNVLVTQNYNEWTLDDREYVPIGLQMLYGDDAVLYIVSPDGKEIYRSVTGRPLDFVIAVDSTGSKVGTEQAGGAPALSHKVSFNTITAIRKVSNSGVSFLASTLSGTWLVTPDSNTLLFGEPILRNTTVAPTGSINQFSTADLLGDTGYIDLSSVRSFNAVQQTKFNGKNSVFSKQINAIIGNGQVQPSNVCSVDFDNYTLFNLSTVYGRRTLVYDQTLGVFTSVDNWTGAGNGIKMFAVVRVNTSVYKLLYITVDNEIYEAFAGSGVEQVSLYIGDRVPDSTMKSIRPDSLRLTLMNAREPGTINVAAYVDGKLSVTETSDFIRETLGADSTPITPPFGNAESDNVKAITFSLGRDKDGFKIGYYIQWAFDVQLIGVNTMFIESEMVNTIEQQISDFTKYQAAPLEILDFVPKTAAHLAIVTVTGKGFLAVTRVDVGVVRVVNYLTQNDNTISFSIPVEVNTGKIKLTSAVNEDFSEVDLTVV